MSKKPLVMLGMLLAVGATMVLVPSPVDAKKPYMNVMRKHFQLTPETGKCVICHLAGKDPDEDTLNSYGKEMKASPLMAELLKAKQPSPAQLEAVAKAADSIGDKDADGDGVSNNEEINLNSLPGDEKSKPDQKALDKYRKEHPPKK